MLHRGAKITPQRGTIAENGTQGQKARTDGKAHHQWKSSPVEKLTPPMEKLTSGKAHPADGKAQALIFAVRSASVNDLRKSPGNTREIPRRAAGNGS